MTSEEAIKIINQYDVNFYWDNGESISAEKLCDAFDLAIEALKTQDQALNEWCTDCKEYDQEKHCCPRFNRVIKSALEDATDTNVGDTVSRQGLLDAFGLSEKTRKYGGDHSGYDTLMLYEIQDVIEGMPPAEPQERKWIPCSERLPEHSYTKRFWLTVITDNNTLETVIGKWSAWTNQKIDNSYDAFTCWKDVLINGSMYRLSQPIPADKVVAWMPLPEQYKEIGHENDRR